MAHRSEKVTFPGSRAGALAGRLELPIGRTVAYALFAHCFTCSKDSLAASRISRALADRGIAVLRFDFTGLGGSEGDFANTDFSSNTEDLVAAAEYLRRHHRAPGLLVGHSLGGAAVLAAAARIPEATAVATVAAPADPTHVTRLLGPAVPEITSSGEATVQLAGRSFRIRQQFLEDLAAQGMADRVRALRKALLVFHAPLDAVVGVDNARRLFETARHPKSFVALDGADHLLSRAEDAAFVAGMLAAWAPRYLPAARTPGATDVDADGGVTVTEAGEGRFTQELRVGRHRLRADEPTAFGGLDLGPSPYDLLLASLGSCTSMTIRMYAERKQWPLEGVSVQLSHEKIHARDCAACETSEGRVDHIARRVRLDGPLDDAQRGRLLEIADRCPVHRTLHSEVAISTELVAGDGPPA